MMSVAEESEEQNLNRKLAVLKLTHKEKLSTKTDSAKSSILGNITRRKKVYKLNGSTGSDEAKSDFAEESYSKLSQNQQNDIENLSTNILGNVTRKKCIEPKPQLQLLTIQSLYDNDDDITVHPLNLNASNWVDRNYDLNKRKLQRENSSLALFSHRNLTNKQSFSKIINRNFNLYPNKIHGLLNTVHKKQEPSKSKLTENSKNQTGKTVKYINDTKNTGLNKFSQNKSQSNNFEYSVKYLEYKRNWDDILLKAKRRHDNKWKSDSSNTAKLEDFEIKQTLGNGSYGTVLLCKHIETNIHYAIKVLKKKSVVKSKQVSHTLMEKKILGSISFPFITSLVYSFKDNSNLYMVLPFVAGGEMFAHLHKVSRFSEALTKFYMSQIVLAVEYLHNLDIIHRDLKPENTLISADGYIKISDFGFAKHVPGRTYTLCGTPEYFAPEMIKGKAYGKAVDWWAVGVLTFELATKEPPFQHSDQLKLYEKILNARMKMPAFLSDDIKDFMQCLVQTDVTKRFGNLKGGVSDIKTHKWFSGIDWMKIYERKVKVPNGIPKLVGPHDASRFDKCISYEISSSNMNEFENEFKTF